MPNQITKFTKYLTLLDEVYKKASVTSVLDSGTGPSESPNGDLASMSIKKQEGRTVSAAPPTRRGRLWSFHRSKSRIDQERRKGSERCC